MRTILVALALGFAVTHEAVSAVVAKASCSVDDASKSDCGYFGIDQVQGGGHRLKFPTSLGSLDCANFEQESQ